MRGVVRCEVRGPTARLRNIAGRRTERIVRVYIEASSERDEYCRTSNEDGRCPVSEDGATRVSLCRLGTGDLWLVSALSEEFRLPVAAAGIPFRRMCGRDDGILRITAVQPLL